MSNFTLRGEKPIFGLLSKNNTGMAALCAGLPVIIITIIQKTFVRHAVSSIALRLAAPALVR